MATSETKVPTTFKEQLELLQEVARADGDDFRMRVFRKPSVTATQMDVVAVFDNARIEHFSTPETWISDLCGGGHYALAAMHANNINQLITLIVPPMIPGAPRAANPAIMKSPSWSGPAIMLFPKPEAPVQPVGLFSGPGAAPTVVTPREGVHSSQGGTGASSSDDVTSARLALLDQARRYDMERLEKLIDAQSKSSEKQVAALLDLVKSAAARPVVERPPEKPLLEQIAPLLAAAMPLVTAFVGQAAENRKLDAEKEARREEREARAREESSKAMQSILDKLSSGNSESAKIMQSMADVVANSLKGQMQMAATVRELMASDAPPPEDGIIGLAKAVAPIVGDFLTAKVQTDAAMAAARAPAGHMNAAPTLPPRPPAPPPAATPPAAPGAGAGAVGDAGASPEPTDEEMAAALAQANPQELATEIVNALKEHRSAEEVAGAYLDALQLNEGFRNSVNAANGTISFFQGHLGPWVMETTPGADGKTNGAYLRNVVGTLHTLAQARGMRV